MSAVIEAFGRSRLLTFDRDPLTRGPTAEVAHEALLREWPRLREWLAASRADVRLQRQLAHAAHEWDSANRDVSFLLTGAHLAQFDGWLTNTTLALTPNERAFYEASVAEQEQRMKEEQTRKAREAALEKRARQVLQALVGVFLLAALVAGGLAWWANDRREAAIAAEQQAVSNLALSDAQRLAAESKTLILEGRDASTAALLALRSIGLHYTPQGDEALSQALFLDYPSHLYTGHTALLWGGGFLPGNDIIFTTSIDNEGTIRLWKVATGEVVRSFDVQNGCLDARLSPDKRLLAASCEDGFAHVWDLGTGQEIRRFEHKASSNPRVRWSPDGRQLLTCGVDTVIKLWDFESGQLIREFTPADSALPAAMGIAFTPDGKQFVTGGQDKILRLWDVETGAQIRTFVGHTDLVWGVDISPDGKYLVSSSVDSGGARLWDLATGQELRRFVQVNSMAPDVAFSPDGRYVFTGGWDTTARIWDVQTSREVRRFNHPQAALGMAFSPDGKYALTASWDNVARLWELQADTGLPRYSVLGSPAYGALSPDGRLLAVSSADNIVRLWDAQTGQELRRFVGHTGPIWDVAFSRDGQYLATTGWSDNSTRLWDAQSGKALWTDAIPSGTSVAFSTDGQKLLVVAEKAGLYDTATGKIVQSFAYSELLQYGAYAPDGATAATAFGGREGVLLWDTATGQILRTFLSDAGDVIRAVVYSPDGKYLAAAAIPVRSICGTWRPVKRCGALSATPI
jgi:WD40 repeat protein